MHDTALLNSWNTVNRIKCAVHPHGTSSSATYSEFKHFLANQSKTYDIATPFKRSTRHAHQADFNSFIDSNNDPNDDDDSVLEEAEVIMNR